MEKIRQAAFKAVLFDLDGTLLDTIDDIADTMNAILRQMGLPEHSVDEYKKYVGSGIDVLIHHVMPSVKYDDNTAKVFSELEEKWRVFEKTKPYEGIAELLLELSARGIKMAILSNRADKSTRTLVKKLLNKWNFDVVVGAGNDFPLKPDPSAALAISRSLNIEPSNFLYLGDSDVDMLMAVNAGMYPVGALWGFRNADELKKVAQK